jgi:long-chain acyl-CoA synthetase
MAVPVSDVIPLEAAEHLPGLFRERVRRSADAIAYRHYSETEQTWQDFTWQDMANYVALWQTAMQRVGLNPGDRVAIMLRNCPQWVMFEQAALGLGLVVVPLYTNDRAENLGYIIDDANIQLILIESKEHWDCLSEVYHRLGNIKNIVSVTSLANVHDDRVKHLDEWLPQAPETLNLPDIETKSLATIIYTSGTTGHPKGVMLSHYNILWNASSAAACEAFYTTDIFLSFLPLSHTFERTAGYYLAMLTGGTVAYARSIEQLAEDLLIIRPTILVTVPRIFERVYNKIKLQLTEKPPIASKLFHATVNSGWQRFLQQQGREYKTIPLLFWPLLNRLVGHKVIQKLGGRLRLAISGGAPLSFDVAKTFIGLGLNITQGYGMTELSPVVSTNRLADNEPASVGQTLPDVEVKLSEQNELLVRSPGLMLGYWNNPEATREIIDDEGWLHTGDVAQIKRDHIYITGRLKEIIVLANGEKVSPADLELAISTDPLFEQVMLVGEGKPFLSALVVLNQHNWEILANSLAIPADKESSLDHPDVQNELLKRITDKLAAFPGYAKIFRVVATLEPWTVEAGLITPTLKLKRNCLIERYEDVIVGMYEGH